MRIFPISDLQLDTIRGFINSDRHFVLENVEAVARMADVVVVAGDLKPPLVSSISYLRDLASLVPVIYVPGNRDFYGREMNDELSRAVEAAETAGVTLLSDGIAEVDDIKFIGTTLWTDFELYGENLAEEAQRWANGSLCDFHAIRIDSGPWRTCDQKERFEASARFIREALFDETRRTVVITHHAPHEKSINPAFKDCVSNASFASDMTDLMTGDDAPDLWIHGATHSHKDYLVGKTRVLSNPVGYKDEHTGFKSDFVVTLN